MTPREEIERERRRQVEAEGWTPEHDDAHAHGELFEASTCYYLAGTAGVLLRPDTGAPVNWPWSLEWWKPHGKRRDLVRAGALALAERDRLRRRDPRATCGHVNQWLGFIATALEAAPRRIRRERSKGWRMPAGAIYVGRGSRWGNPFKVDPTNVGGYEDWRRNVDIWRDWPVIDAATAAEAFREMAMRSRQRRAELPRLAGHDLACWCALDAPCHADVLLELANPSQVQR